MRRRWDNRDDKIFKWFFWFFYINYSFSFSRTARVSVITIIIRIWFDFNSPLSLSFSLSLTRERPHPTLDDLAAITRIAVDGFTSFSCRVNFSPFFFFISLEYNTFYYYFLSPSEKRFVKSRQCRRRGPPGTASRTPYNIDNTTDMAERTPHLLRAIRQITVFRRKSIPPAERITSERWRLPSKYMPTQYVFCFFFFLFVREFLSTVFESCLGNRGFRIRSYSMAFQQGICVVYSQDFFDLFLCIPYTLWNKVNL